MAAIVLVAGACQGGEAGEGEGPIVIASANPMSGGSGYYGQTKVRGMQLAMEEVNEAGGIDGRQVRLEVGDDAGDPTQGASLAQRYCSNDEILAVLGHWNSSVSLAAVPIYDRCGLPAVNDNVNRMLSGASEYSFRIFSTDILEGIALAIFSRDEGYQRAAILHDTNDYGIGLKDAYQDAFEERGGQVVAVESYIEGAKNFRPQASSIQAANPDVIFMAGYHVETGLAAKQMRSLGMQQPLLGGDGIESPDLIELGGDAVEGIIFTGNYHADLPVPGNEEFVQNFEERFGTEPDTFAALAYDAMRLVLQAIEEVGASRDTIRDYLDDVQDFPGVTGTITFDDKNDAIRPVYLVRVEGGQFVLHEKQVREDQVVPLEEIV